MLVRILGFIDLCAAVIFLMFAFGLMPLVSITLFCAGLLLLKSLFILGGDVLSALDLLASIALILSIFFSLPLVLLWAPGFLLLAKGMASFL